jgi:hypothetical protein
MVVGDVMSIIYSEALLSFSFMRSCQDKKDSRELDGVQVAFYYTVYAPEQGKLNWECDGISIQTMLDFSIPSTDKTFQAPSRQRLQSEIDNGSFRERGRKERGCSHRGINSIGIIVVQCQIGWM